MLRRLAIASVLIGSYLYPFTATEIASSSVAAAPDLEEIVELTGAGGAGVAGKSASRYDPDMIAQCILPEDEETFKDYMPVGFDNGWPDPNPFVGGHGGCGDAYQTQVIFPLGKLKQPRVHAVRQAIFQFDEQMAKVQAFTENDSCITEVHAATPDQDDNDWYHYYQDSYVRTDGTDVSRKWDVTSAVNNWFTDNWANHGLVLRGYDETINPHSTYWACWSRVSNFSLHIIVEADPVPPPPPPPPPPKPSLKVVNVDVADKTGGIGCTSGEVNVFATVRNDGDVNVGTYEITLRSDEGDSQTLITGPVDAHSERRESFPTIGLNAGKHDLHVIVDPEHQIDESNEADNETVVSVNCAVGVAPTPTPKPVDVQISKIEVQDPNGKPGCVAGSNVVMSTVKNSGDTESGNFNVQLKVDNSKSGPSTSIGGIPPRSEKSSAFSDVKLSKGNHTLMVSLDPDNKITEGDEGNNSLSAKVNCTGGN